MKMRYQGNINIAFETILFSVSNRLLIMTPDCTKLSSQQVPSPLLRTKPKTERWNIPSGDHRSRGNVADCKTYGESKKRVNRTIVNSHFISSLYIRTDGG